MIGYGVRSQAFKFKSKKFEKPGRYFHPLLGTLITGAARLMLALAENQVMEQKLDWAFCDTDSIAIANTNDLPLDEFKARAFMVRNWFKDLNPYGEDNSILQLEKVNFHEAKEGDLGALNPPYCLAVSAKRYVLFNRTDVSPVIRKASGHGLGHLLAPYDESSAERRARVERIGVPLWQEDPLEEWLGADRAKAPKELLAHARQALIDAALVRIERAKEQFLSRKKKERDVALESSWTNQSYHYPGLFRLVADADWEAKCPACGGKAYMAGILFQEVVSDELVDEYGEEEAVDKHYVGEEFRCPVCNLYLASQEEIEAVDLNTEHIETELRERRYEEEYNNE